MSKFLDLLSESSVFIEATDLGIQPNMEGILQINNEAFQESCELDSAMIHATNRMLLDESARALSENFMSNVFAKIKKIIENMLAKMKEFYKNLRLYFDKAFQKESKFAETYKDEIAKISNVEIDGQDIDPENIKLLPLWNLIKKASDGIKAADEDTTKLKNGITNSFARVDAKQFKQGLMTLAGFKPKTVKVSMNGSKIAQYLTNLNASINAVKADEDEVMKAYNNALSEVDKAAKDFANTAKETKSDSEKKANEKGSKIATKKAELIKDCLGLLNTAAGIKAGCYKTLAKQAKMAAYKGIAANRKTDKSAKSKDEEQK